MLDFISRVIADATVARVMKLHFNTAMRQDTAVRFHLIADATATREIKLHFNTVARQDNPVRFHFTIDSRRDCLP